MKSSILIAVLSLFLNGCATINTGHGPHADAVSAPNDGILLPARDISFSVSFVDEYGPGSWIGEREVLAAIRKELENSGLFNRVRLCSPEEASANHCHFDVYLTCTRMGKRIPLMILSIASCTMIPTWMNVHLDWDMTYVQDGHVVLTRSSQQSAQDTVWGPAIVAAPLMNRFTTGHSMKRKPMRYFIRELKLFYSRQNAQ